MLPQAPNDASSQQQAAREVSHRASDGGVQFTGVSSRSVDGVIDLAPDAGAPMLTGTLRGAPEGLLSPVGPNSRTSAVGRDGSSGALSPGAGEHDETVVPLFTNGTLVYAG